MTDIREEIIARYRDRITTGERTKLSLLESDRLIETFVEQLQGLTTQDEIKALCEAEITLLEEGYPKPTIGKDRLRYYRAAIKTAMAEGKLPMTDETSRRYTYIKRETGETEEAHDHRSLDFLKYDQATYGAIAGHSAERNNQKQDSLKPVNPDVYLAKAAELLRSDDPFELAVGIAAVTGRRFSEVIDKGTIGETDHPDWVSFSGQLKKKVEADRYMIPCLVPASDVLRAIERFRNHPRVTRVAGKTTTQINNSLADSVKRAVSRHFEKTGIIPVLENESRVTMHNLRGVYAQIAVHFFCPPAQGEARFMQEKLGHVISEEEMKRSNSSATQHYFHYRLVDGNGKHIGSKGVKLTDGEPLPTLIKPTIERSPETLPEAQPIEPSESPIAVTTLADQVEALTLEIKRIWSHVEKMNPSANSAPTATDTSFFTREIESLRSELVEMQQERDQATAELEQVKGEQESLQRQLAQERQAYQQRIDGLIELLKQSPSIAQPISSQPLETTPTVTEATVEPKPMSQPETLVQTAQPKPRREHVTKSGSADKRVEAAMRLLMQWNREHDSDSNKFAITQSLLQKTTGSNMPAVKRVMEAFRNEIYEHNSEYALDPDRHNYGKDVEEIKAFVKTRL